MDNLAYDYSLCEEHRRLEMIGGKIYMMSGPATNHISTAGNIYSLFKNYLRGKPCKVYGDGMTVYLSDEDYVVPDMSVVCDTGKIKHKGIYGAPDLVVEILSPSTKKRDLGEKLKLYEMHGVKEYWVVSTADKSVSIYLPVDGRFVLANVHLIFPDYELEDMTAEEQSALVTEFSPFLFPDMKIALDEVFEDMLE